MKTNADKSTGSKLRSTLRAAEMVLKLAQTQARVTTVQAQRVRKKFKAAKKEFKQAKKEARQAKRKLAAAQAAFEETCAKAEKSQAARRAAIVKAKTKPAEVARQKVVPPKMSKAAGETRPAKKPLRPPLPVPPEVSSAGIASATVPEPAAGTVIQAPGVPE